MPAESTIATASPLRLDKAGRIFRMGEVDVPALVDVDLSIEAVERFAEVGNPLSLGRPLEGMTVLKPGGRLQVADMSLVDGVNPELLERVGD